MTAGVQEAVAKAKAHAGERIVALSGANLTQGCLNAGLVDQISIDLVPVLLGGGIRYLDNVADAPVWLDGPRVIEGIGVTHLIYDVQPR